MRIKTYLSLIAFAAAFVLSVSLAGLPKDNFYSGFAGIRNYRLNRQNIRSLLRQDIGNGMLRDSIIESFEGNVRDSRTPPDIAPYAEAVEEYVDASQSIDDSDLPADFQAAWQNHMNAWREHSDYLNQIEATVREDEASGRKRLGFSMNPGDGNAYQKQHDEIERTWFEVLRIAGKYGVDTSRYY